MRSYQHESHDQLRDYVAAFVGAHNFAKRVKALAGLTPFEAICKAWTKEPQRFRLVPDHLTSGPEHLGATVCADLNSVQQSHGADDASTVASAINLLQHHPSGRRFVGRDCSGRSSIIKCEVPSTRSVRQGGAHEPVALQHVIRELVGVVHGPRLGSPFRRAAWFSDVDIQIKENLLAGEWKLRGGTWLASCSS